MVRPIRKLSTDSPERQRTIPAIKRVPDLNSYHVPTREVERLMDVVRDTNGFIGHDLLIPLGGLLGNLEIALKVGRTNPADSETWTRRVFLALGLGNELVVSIHTLFRRAPSRSRWLVSTPYLLTQNILNMLPGTQIAVHPRASRTLKILYPPMALFSMISELVRNARRHTQNASICLMWRLAEGRFRYSVHDAGQGMVHNLPTRYVPLEFFQLPTPNHGHLGLVLISQIVSTSGGFTLIRRSPLLGGTEVCLDLPVTAYCVGRSKREHS